MSLRWRDSVKGVHRSIKEISKGRSERARAEENVRTIIVETTRPESSTGWNKLIELVAPWFHLAAAPYNSPLAVNVYFRQKSLEATIINPVN